MITISLPPDVEQFVLQAVAEGKYPNEQDVVTDAIRLLRDLRKRHQRLRGEIDEALASVDRGEGFEIDSDDSLAAFFDDLEREAQATIAAEKKGDG
jgi:putative addiction module CopG family antidote